MKIFAKGSQKYATEVLFVNSTKLYLDAEKTVELTQAVAKKLVPSKTVVTDGTSYLTITSMAINGSEIVVGETTYSIAE